MHVQKHGSNEKLSKLSHLLEVLQAQIRKAKRKLRSGFEDKIKAQLDELDCPYEYEPDSFEYTIKSKYIPDFKLKKSGIYLEVKGYFDTEDRRKMDAVKKQHPHLDIRFIFQRAANKVHKQSSMTYGDWATKHGFPWAEKVVPKEWLK